MVEPLITAAPKGADRVFDNRDLEPDSYCALWLGQSGSSKTAFAVRNNMVPV